MKLSADTHSADDVIRLLGLEPIPEEGGWFRRLGAGGGIRPDGRRGWSRIYALFTPEGFSALHRLASDELWCFHAGDALETLRLHPDGRGEREILGLGIDEGEQAQLLVPGGVWQGARVVDGGRWTLVSCVVLPEFRREDFVLGERDRLIVNHPQWEHLIRRLTRG